jgi:hypothetical protein
MYAVLGSSLAIGPLHIYANITKIVFLGDTFAPTEEDDATVAWGTQPHVQAQDGHLPSS